MLKNTFEHLLTQTQSELLTQLPKYLKSKGYTEIIEKDYAIGFKSPKASQPVLVAHLDTINSKGATAYYVSSKKALTSSDNKEERTPTLEDILFTGKYILLSPEANSNIICLGADDRVGVKTILDLVEKGHMPHILFTTDEESGCVGSRELIKHNDFDFLKDATMFIQVDRGVHENSWHEMVFYSFDTSKVPSILEELENNYDLATGSYTDVAVLGPHFNKPIVNLSASYENEHTRQEFLNLYAYEYNTASLDSFLNWTYTQDHSDWVWYEKPKPKVTSYYGAYTPQAPKFVWNEPRVYDGKMTIPELINDMYRYPNKDKKVNYNWNCFKSENEKENKDFLISYAEKCVIACYKEGLFLENYQALNALLTGEIYEEWLEPFAGLDEPEEYEEWLEPFAGLDEPEEYEEWLEPFAGLDEPEEYE